MRQFLAWLASADRRACRARRRAPRQRRGDRHLSPGQFETINPYGTLTFDIPGVLGRPRRPQVHLTRVSGRIAGRLAAFTQTTPFLAHLRAPVGADALQDVARRRIAGGAGWIKLLADAPGPDGNMLAAQPMYPVELVQRVCETVHQAGGRVAAHSTGPVAPALVDAGVDSIEHGDWLDAAAVARLGARGGAGTPTLSTVMWYLDPMIAGGQAAPMLSRHLEALAATLSGAVAAGVVVLAGTDERPHGSIGEEIDLLARFGLTSTEAEAAASTAARAYVMAA